MKKMRSTGLDNLPLFRKLMEDEDWYKSFSDPKTGDLSVLWDR